ncbi:MAG: DHH family phosphoesterase [Roseiflexus sp.]|nr:DHH family phosphoesterase [Roseiflexus sp.]MCS7289427.1 DHH family phosphoesterase [Roseiflexus sp.]MDW8144893.1 DHH family phosphoesterase [Roseiflexaceae bacterium]MDW8233912.1 DHH family phosphoesterase [Roseiflexaceae bacterium]
MISNDPAVVAAPIAERIAAAQHILILTHINPDGDAVGASLAVWHALGALGKQRTAILTPPIPVYAAWLPGADQIVFYQSGMALPPADLAILVDTAHLTRIGPIYDEHSTILATAPVIVIDHHVTNHGGGALNLIDPDAASTCDLLYRLFCAMGIQIDRTIATCLLLGLTTDTQSFQTNATRPTSLRTAAALLEAGADHAQIVRAVYYGLPASSAALMGRALANLRCEHGVVWTTVDKRMFAETGAEEEAADEVIRVLQRIGEARVMALFKERSDGTTKMSLRARAPLNVAAVAQRWGGGGHAQAAGANLPMTPTEAIAVIIPLLKELAAHDAC